MRYTWPGSHDTPLASRGRLRASVTVFRCVCFIGFLATAALVQPLRAGPASTDSPRDAPSLAFGAKIIDLALTFDAAAQQSLVAASDIDVPATMTFRDASGAEQTYHVTIRIKGQLGSRRRLDEKPAFKVKLGKDDRFFGLEHLTLNNMVQDPTMVHEALGYQVYEAAGVTVPTTGYARLTVNGHAYGLYLNLETTDARFLKRRFSDDSGILYEGAYGVDLRAGDEEKFQLHEGRDPDRAQLKTLVRALDAPGEGIFYGGSPLVDTVSFLHMMAAGVLLDDWDNYYSSNNYRMYWNPAASRWFFVPTGIDQTFAGDSTTVFGATGLLFQKCLAFERCTNDYLAALREVAGAFDRLGLAAKMDALLSVIDAAAQADPKKYYDAATMQSARGAMRAFIATRPNEVRAALSCMDGGREATVGACAGIVAVNVAFNQCLEVVSRTAAQNPGIARVSRCEGGIRQRWHLVAKGDAFSLVASNGNCLEVTGGSPDEGATLQQSACTGVDSQLFFRRSVTEDAQFVAKRSGKCVAATPGNPRDAAALVQVTCTQDSAQAWRLQRSIYK
jgi:CotH kinase protein/Ricin-type beta-trefoil lectin domain